VVAAALLTLWLTVNPGHHAPPPPSHHVAAHRPSTPSTSWVTRSTETVPEDPSVDQQLSTDIG
jgi:hypothetical protein